MYAYAIRPETIPSSYYRFILKTYAWGHTRASDRRMPALLTGGGRLPARSTRAPSASGPIDEVVLQNVRRNVRGQPVDVSALNAYIAKKGGPANYLTTDMPRYLSNTVLHPQEPNWVRNGARPRGAAPPCSHACLTPSVFCRARPLRRAMPAWRVFLDSFGKILPLYTSLTFAPMLLLQFRKILSRCAFPPHPRRQRAPPRDLKPWLLAGQGREGRGGGGRARPVSTISEGVLSAGRSTTFLAAFVALYQFFTSMHRRLLDVG